MADDVRSQKALNEPEPVVVKEDRGSKVETKPMSSIQANAAALEAKLNPAAFNKSVDKKKGDSAISGNEKELPVDEEQKQIEAQKQNFVTGNLQDEENKDDS